MRVLKMSILALVLGSSLFIVPNGEGGDGLFKCFHKERQGPTTTTPTRAFLQRQCDALKRGIANIPGMRNIMANH